MTLAQSAGLDRAEGLVRQIEQADEVRDGDAAAADASADLLAGEAELLGQRRTGARLLDRVEVLAGHVLDQRHLERGGVVVMADDRRDRLELGERAARQRRSPAISSYVPPATGRTRTGCSTPRTLIDSASASSDSSSNRRRGWCGLGVIISVGSSRSSSAPVTRRDRQDRGQAAAHPALALSHGRCSPHPRAATSLASSK